MKVHQNIILNGQDMGDAAVRRFSKFCNEGKWENFIKPLLPDGEVFVEFGSNAGLFLRLATEAGYKAIGFERDKKDCGIARQYRDNLRLNYKIVETQVDEKLDYLADITLLANFHYHQHVSEFVNLLDSMETKTCYVLIVSVNDIKEPHWRAQPDQKSVERYFQHWDLVGQINPIPQKNDPHPREMFSYLFKSKKIKRIPIEEIKPVGGKEGKEWEDMIAFVTQVLKDRNLDIKKTKYYKTQAERRKNKWSQETLDKFVAGKKDLILDIADNGFRRPVILDNGLLVDGLHRYLTAIGLGQKGIIAR